MQYNILNNGALEIQNYSYNFTANYLQVVAKQLQGQLFFVSTRKSFQSVVGASRQRAAPRSQ